MYLKTDVMMLRYDRKLHPAGGPGANMVEILMAG